MDKETLAMVVSLLTLIMALISWAIQIFVVRQLKKSGLEAGTQIGKRSWMKPFVLGWKNAEELGIQELMIVWSFVFGITIIGVIGTALLFALPN